MEPKIMRWRQVWAKNGVGLTTVLFFSASFPPTVAAAEQVNVDRVCRAQLVMKCADRCEVENMPADLELDFVAMAASFCRGSRCDEGTLSFEDEKGQWDDRRYRIFSVRKTGTDGFTVSGVIDLQTETFVSVGSDVPMSFGRCIPK